MPLTQEDLQFRLVADVETQSLKVIKELGKQINVTWEAQLGILDRAFQKLSNQQGKLTEMKVLQDPTILKETVRMRMEEEEMMRKQLETVKEIEKTIPIEVLDVRKRYQEITLDNLKAQREQIERIKALMEPDALKEQVKLEQELLKVQEEYATAKEKLAPADVLVPTMGERMMGAFKGGGIGGALKELKDLAKEGMSGMSTGKLFGGLMSGKGASGVEGVVGSTGPQGALLGAIPILSKALGKLAATPFKTITGGLHSLSSGLHELQGGLGPIGAAASMVSGAIGMVGQLVSMIPVIGEVLGPLIMAIAPIPKIFADITQSLVNMTRLSSPGVFKLWEVALMDTQAVIGRSFTPVLQMMTTAVREFADLLATVLPTTKEMKGIFSPLLDSWTALMGVLMDNRDAIHELLIVGLNAMVAVLNGLILTVLATVKAFDIFLKPFGYLLKLLGMGGVEAKSSYGASAQSATLGSLESYQNKLIESAFTVPGAKEDPAATTIPFLQQIQDTLLDIWDWFTGTGLIGILTSSWDVLVDLFRELPNMLMTALSELPNAIGSAISGIISGIIPGGGGAVASAGGSFASGVAGAVTDPFGLGRAISGVRGG